MTDEDPAAAKVNRIQEAGQIIEQADYDRKRILARRAGERAADKEEASLRRIVAVRGDQVPIKAMHWLWRGRYPLGGLSLLGGRGEVSKSTVFSCQTAWLTRGEMKGEFEGTPVNVAYVANEDLISETVKPRMVAHGADMTRVFFLGVETPLSQDALSFPRDTELLTRFIRDNDIKATFIDPLSANVTGNRNSQGDMRLVYQQVSGIAQATLTAIIGLAHTRKEGARDIVEAIMGSVEQVNVARSVHGLIMDPDEDGARILSCEKNNLFDKSQLPTLRFSLESVPVMCTDGSGLTEFHPRIKWLEEISETASDILGDALYGQDGVDECARWLYDYLLSQGGADKFAHIVDAAKQRRYSESMLRRARKKIGVKVQRERAVPPHTIWTLPL